MNEPNYINGLLSNNKNVIRAIYKTYLPRIENFIIKNNGSKEDAWEVFQEAIILILKKARQPDFELTSSFYSFLYGLCRYLWSNELRKFYRKEVTIEDSSTYKVSDNILLAIFEEGQFKLFREKMNELNSTCQQVLRLFFDGWKFRDIARKLELPSENAAKQKKFKCQQKLMGMIKSDIRYKELKNG